MKRALAGGLLVAATLLGGLTLTGGAVDATEGPPTPPSGEVCHEMVTQAQYKKFTAPTDAGPWAPYGTWWQGQANKWWPDVGEVAEGPAKHSLGRYTYRRTGQRTVDGVVIPCPKPPTPEPDVNTKWGNCETGSDVVDGEQTTTSYTWMLEGTKWVKVATEQTVDVERPLTEDEQSRCQPPVELRTAIPVDPKMVPPTCEAAGSVVLPTSPLGYAWVLQDDGTYVAVAAEDYVFEEGADTTFEPGNLSILTGERCKAPEVDTEVGARPPSVPSATPPSAALPPILAAVAPVSQQAPPPTAELPATGASTWVMVMLALGFSGAGLGLLRLSRRAV